MIIHAIYKYLTHIYKPSLDKSFTAFFYWKTKTEKEGRFTRNVGLCCSSVWKTICTGSEGIKEYFIHVHTISDILGTVWSTGMTLLFYQIPNLKYKRILRCGIYLIVNNAYFRVLDGCFKQTEWTETLWDTKFLLIHFKR